MASTSTSPRRSPTRLWLVALAALGLSMASLNSGAQTEPRARDTGRTPAGTYLGLTQPSKEFDLAFAIMGRVSEVNIREGDQVEAGQVLLRQDTRADEAQLRGLEANADVAARVALAEVQQEQAKLDVIRLESLGGRGMAAQVELDRARLEAEAAATRIAEERRQGLVAEARAEEQRILIEQKTLQSPDAGVVQRVEASLGEVYGPQTPALRLVKIDPLHVTVLDAPAAEVRRLSPGQTVQVRYGGQDQWQEAKVVFIDPVGDPSSAIEKLPFRLELPNPDGMPAGLRMQVRLPEADSPAQADRR